MAVTFGLAEYHTGERILDLPVLEGASWAAMLNAPDNLDCQIDLRDPEVRALDIPSTTEPKKTVLFASTDSGVILAWGVISDREWDEDERILTITASGGGQYFNQLIIAPPAAATGTIINTDGSVSAAFDTEFNDVTLGTIGKKLVAQALTWDGAPTAYVLPADVAEIGRESGVYRLVDYKRVWSALEDLTKRADGGPDFAFEARRDSTELALEYVMRAGAPLLGEFIGSWPVGSLESPVTKLKVKDDGARLATHVWMQAGRTDSKVIVARASNPDLITTAGYPHLDFVDTTHSDVVIQATLDAYATEHAEGRRTLGRSLSFDVKGTPIASDGTLIGPSLGEYRPGDFVSLDVAAGNPYLTEGEITVRVLGISGDETGVDVRIECEIGELS